jgi:hypothetical protein
LADDAVDGEDDDEGESERAEFVRRCDVAAVAFQELLPLTQVLIVLIYAVFAYAEAVHVARIEPRSRKTHVNSIIAQLGKLRGNVVARFRNREFGSILDELCRHRPVT